MGKVITNMNNIFFLSVLRSGLSTSIKEHANGARAEIDVSILIDRHDRNLRAWEANPQEITKRLALMGPADVLGFEEEIILRTDPPNNSNAFKPNYFPSIEFAQADFPWRFSPEPYSSGGSSAPESVKALTPWVSLIVLKDGAGEGHLNAEFEYLSGKGLATLIKVNSVRSLPDLRYAWRWAHVQVTAESQPDDGELTELLNERPEQCISRLLCARRLQPNTSYSAFIVPSFLLGKNAALRLAGYDVDDQGVSAAELAWNKNEAGQQSSSVVLPFYFHWQFHTTTRGDFEYLTRLLLEPKTPSSELGRKPMDWNDPGYGLDWSGHSIPAMQSALQELSAPDVNQSLSEIPTQVKREISSNVVADGEEFLNIKTPTNLSPNVSNFSAAINENAQKVTIAFSSSTGLKPYILYRRKGLGSFKTVSKYTAKSGTYTFDLPLLPEVEYEFYIRLSQRVRTSRGWASWGYRYVEQYRSENGELSISLPTISPPLYGEHHDHEHNGSRNLLARENWIAEINLDPRYRAAAGLGAKIARKHQEIFMQEAWEQLGEVETANAILRQAQFGQEISDKFKRRIAKFSPDSLVAVTRPMQLRTKSRSEQNKKLTDKVDEITAVPQALNSNARRRISRPRGPLRKKQQHKQFGYYAASGQRENYFRQQAIQLSPESFVNVDFGDHFPNLQQIVAISPLINNVNSELHFMVSEGSHWQLVQRVGQQVKLSASTYVKKNNDVEFEEIAAYPEINIAISKLLSGLSKEWILAGAGAVNNNSIEVLKTNTPFVEALLVGLNYEFARELRWRGYPSDGKGSYFRQFWEKTSLLDYAQTSDDGGVSSKEGFFDIKPIHQWGEAKLGENKAGSHLPDFVEGENMVVLIRGDLIRCYKDLNIYMLDDLNNLDSAILPLFKSYLSDDTLYLGLPRISRGFLVLEENPGAPRFGLDINSAESISSAESVSVADLSWDHFFNDTQESIGSYLDLSSNEFDVLDKNDSRIGRWDRASTSAFRAKATRQKPVRLVVSMEMVSV